MDHVPVILYSAPAQMDNTIDAFQQRRNLGHIRYLRLNEFFVIRQIGRLFPVAEDEARIDAFQQCTQACTDAARGARD